MVLDLKKRGEFEGFEIVEELYATMSKEDSLFNSLVKEVEQPIPDEGITKEFGNWQYSITHTGDGKVTLILLSNEYSLKYEISMENSTFNAFLIELCRRILMCRVNHSVEEVKVILQEIPRDHSIDVVFSRAIMKKIGI